MIDFLEEIKLSEEKQIQNLTHGSRSFNPIICTLNTRFEEVINELTANQVHR